MKLSTPVDLVAIAAITVGQRRRKNLGRLQSLQRSIETNGLLHPIVVRNGNELVAGARRLEACKRLGWKQVPVRRVERMTDDELRSIELDENEQRLALMDYDASKRRLDEIRQAEADARAAELVEHGSTKSRGRPKAAGSKSDIERRTGVKRATQRKIERHVEIAERFPFMQADGWNQNSVLRAGGFIEKLPKKEYPSVAAILQQPGIPPKDAVKILSNLSTMDAPQRKRIYRLAESDDRAERSLALTEAAKLPPDPDVCLLQLVEMRRQACKCKKDHAARIVELSEELIAQLREEAKHV